MSALLAFHQPVHVIQQVPGRTPKRVVGFSQSTSSLDPVGRSTVTYINRHVRADEHVEAPGSVVVHGDVAADASISAAGDVMVWGRYDDSLSYHLKVACSPGSTKLFLTQLQLLC